MRRYVFFLLSCSAWALASASACSHIDESDCLNTRTCPPGSAGQAGESSAEAGASAVEP